MILCSNSSGDVSIAGPRRRALPHAPFNVSVIEVFNVHLRELESLRSLALQQVEFEPFLETLTSL